MRDYDIAVLLYSRNQLRRDERAQRERKSLSPLAFFIKFSRFSAPSTQRGQHVCPAVFQSERLFFEFHWALPLNPHINKIIRSFCRLEVVYRLYDVDNIYGFTDIINDVIHGLICHGGFV